MADFAGKTVLITGAASGFGQAAARRFAALGAKLAISDITRPEAIGADCLATALDVTDPQAHMDVLSQVIDKWGRLDIAINNAGIAPTLAPLHETSVEDYDRVMDVNARGVFLGMRAQLPAMMSQGQGVILNVASAAGLVGAGQMAAYAASKHAVLGLTRSAADEVARHGIRVNAVCPSFAQTPLLEPLQHQMGAQAERITSRIPMRRLASQDEVVQAMVWAVSPDNTFMTGQAIAIDGGLTAI